MSDGNSLMSAKQRVKSGDESDSDGNNGEENVGSTGRWTREEHHLFLKGLEIHGKGWKKIAGLIKTRTVVQIRTHAQKYFLKLHKAKQSGNSCDLTIDGKTGHRRKRRRHYDGPVAVAPPLQPFLKLTSRLTSTNEQPSSENPRDQLVPIQPHVKSESSPDGETLSAGAAVAITTQQGPTYEEIDSSIYNFLSAPFPQENRTRSLSTGKKEETSDNDGTSNSLRSGATDTGSIDSAGDYYAESESGTGRTQWLRQGLGVDRLLQQAESLDWENDAGDAVPPEAYSTILPQNYSYDSANRLGRVGGSNTCINSIVSQSSVKMAHAPANSVKKVKRNAQNGFKFPVGGASDQYTWGMDPSTMKIFDSTGASPVPRLDKIGSTPIDIAQSPSGEADEFFDANLLIDVDMWRADEF